MKKLVEYFLNNSLVVNLITAVLVIVGAVSAYTLKKEMFPDVSFDVITVATSYPGSSAEDVEKLQADNAAVDSRLTSMAVEQVL